MSTALPSKNLDRNHTGAGTGTEIQLLSNADNTCATLVLSGEDHTLARPLNYLLQSTSEFSGYSIPHPSEMKVQMRIQTKGRPVTDVLIDTTDLLTTICDHTLSTFDEAEKRYLKAHPPQKKTAHPAAATTNATPAKSSSKKKKSSDAMED